MKDGHFLRKYVLAGISLFAVTLFAWLTRDVLTLANFIMLYMLTVFIIAIRLGTREAITAALVSFLSINFFLTRPYYSFIIADHREVIDLVVFLIVATLAGELGALARQQTHEAQRRADEQEILYRFTGLVNQATESNAVYDVLTKAMREDLHASNAYLLPYKSEPRATDESVHFLLLQAGERIYGTLCVAFNNPLTPEQSRLIQTCAAQAAIALQRIELAERARTSQQYEEADRLKTAILRAVSHDLRTPITIIKTSASNLRTLAERMNPSEQQELYGTIESEADHLNKLIGNLLDLSRLQAGALTLNSELNSLEEVIGDIAARVWQKIGRERLDIQFPDHMPLVPFDYGLMLQALTNLVDNALRYEPDATQIEIRGSVDPTNNEAQLRVVNHGERISEADREHLMEPFYHGKGGNTGLGLPIAKGIIEAHHGALRVEDTPGSGATFVISLPMSRKESIEDEIKNPGG
jgi:two-component system sensor histidine kinase KdpD